MCSLEKRMWNTRSLAPTGPYSSCSLRSHLILVLFVKFCNTHTHTYTERSFISIDAIIYFVQRLKLPSPIDFLLCLFIKNLCIKGIITLRNKGSLKNEETSD